MTSYLLKWSIFLLYTCQIKQLPSNVSFKEFSFLRVNRRINLYFYSHPSLPLSVLAVSFYHRLFYHRDMFIQEIVALNKQLFTWDSYCIIEKLY